MFTLSILFVLSALRFHFLFEEERGKRRGWKGRKKRDASSTSAGEEKEGQIVGKYLPPCPVNKQEACKMKDKVYLEEGAAIQLPAPTSRQ